MMANYTNRFWHRFFRRFSENAEVTKASPAFNFLVSDNTVPLMVKVVEGAMLGPSRRVRMHASIVLQELTEIDLLHNLYPVISFRLLICLRRCALHLMIHGEVGSDEHEAGLLFTVYLLRLALWHNDIHGWVDLADLLELAFTENLGILDMFIDVVCELIPDNRYVSRFLNFVAPCVLRNLDPFISRLQWMFAQGDDHGVFVLLPFLYTELTETSWKRLLSAAITSPFFHNESRPSNRAIASHYLEKSVHITEYTFSQDWVTPMNGIIDVLLNSTDRDRPNDLREMISGIRMRAAMLTKNYD